MPLVLSIAEMRGEAFTPPETEDVETFDCILSVGSDHVERRANGKNCRTGGNRMVNNLPEQIRGHPELGGVMGDIVGRENQPAAIAGVLIDGAHNDAWVVTALLQKK